MSKNAADEWEAPAGALHGFLVNGLGWLLTDSGNTKLQPGDLVLTIGEIGGEMMPVNEAWFAHHWMEMQYPDPPKAYNVTFWRHGEVKLRTLTVSRS